MTIVFTICSNNYLAQAKTLMDSLFMHSTDFNAFICLVDEPIEEIDYISFLPAQIIPAREIGIENFDDLTQKYNIVELNTSVKPSFFKYLISRFPNCDCIIYFDPDIFVYTNVSHFNSLFEDKCVLLTPHVLTPIPLDGLKPQEPVFLSHGIFNLGFIAIQPQNREVSELLDWWEERCLKLCYILPQEGLFVDQYWVNFFPVFSKNVKILYDPGYNMAPWNLHERLLTSSKKNNYTVNEEYSLRFYHFSSYKHNKPEQICPPFYNRYNFATRNDLIELYSDYHNQLKTNNVEFFEIFQCKLLKQKVLEPEVIIKQNKFKKTLQSLTPPLIYNFASILKEKVKG